MAKPRAYVGSFTLRLGNLTTQGRLLPVRQKIRSQYVLCTPGEDPQPVRRCYVDPTEKVWWEGDLGRAEKDADGNLFPVDPEQVAGAKVSDLPLNYLNLTAHPVEDVDNSLFPADSNAYVFDPVIKNSSGKVVDNPVNKALHDLFNVLVRDHPELAFVGRCNLNNYEGVYRIKLHMGYMTLQKQLHPEEINQYEFMDRPTVKATDRAKGEKILSSLIAPYNDATYADTVATRLAEISSEDFDPQAALERVNAPVEIDLDSILDAALADFD